MVSSIPMRFEALVTSNETILKQLYFAYNPTAPNLSAIPNSHRKGHPVVYSFLLDEALNVDSYEVFNDDTSKLYVFKLSSDMCITDKDYKIGLKDFDDAYLLIELFDGYLK